MKLILIICILCIFWVELAAQNFSSTDSTTAKKPNKLASKDTIIPSNASTASLHYLLPISEKAVRMSYPLEASFGKTTHIIFPSRILYVDIGSDGVIADKADP